MDFNAMSFEGESIGTIRLSVLRWWKHLVETDQIYTAKVMSISS